ncbi:MAG: heterodisulfide reductase-related iron-sulfur binding cluster [Acidimicrobiia bacterium]|nr:heterodisulfide reductase-related iron-sulfur binding cluster [Acidimicrobiia bacterium]
MMDLGIDPDELAACVSCGLCLPHCPTYRVTGDDMVSPRGRISLMRAVQDDDAPLLDEVVRSMETCVQCRGCEPACPSGVPFGHLMEATRHSLAERHTVTPRYQRLGMKVLGRPGLLRAGSSALAVAQRLRLVPSGRLGLPDRLPVRRRPMRSSGTDVILFTGCVMDAWQRDVHVAAQRVLEAAGFGVTPSGDAAPCCGALHTHAGLTDDATSLARRTMAGLEGDTPIVVDSAGCGAALKDYGHLLGTDVARQFSARVFDIHEWLARDLDRLPEATPLDLAVAVQDPCHLRHVQRAHEPVRTVLAPYVRELRELDDDGLCCGAGGAFAVVEPEMAGAIRDRKRAAIDRTAPDVVASANPGCSLHLAATGLDVRHPMELIAQALA